MNFHFVPSLQSKAVTKIVTFLWNGADVVALIANYDKRLRDDLWWQIEEKVKDKISLLPPLPVPLRRKLSSLVKPVGDEILRWKRTHVRKFQFKNIPREFYWTSQGTVDKKRTAEAFIHDLSIPEEERYDMACLYCFEWDRPIPFDGTVSYPMEGFKSYWIYDKMGDVTALDSTSSIRDPSMTPYQWAFDYAVDYRNDVAAECYFWKLSPGEREVSLSNIQLSRNFIDLDFFRFLLLHMNEEQQSKVLQGHAEDLLISLLNWPWQPLFMDGARRVRDILEFYQYSSLLSRIIEKIRQGYEDYCYRELFGELWGQMPADHKKKMINDDDCDLFYDLLTVVGEENILFLLKGLSPEEKEQILFSDRGIYICESLVGDDEWEALKFFITDCITSHDKMIRFKEKCDKERILNHSFCQLLDELIEKFSKKRGGEEADCSMPKRLCRSSDV